MGADLSGTPSGQLSRGAVEQTTGKCTSGRWVIVTGEFLPITTTEQDVHGCTYLSDNNYDPFRTGSIRYNITTQTTYYDSCTPGNVSASFTEYYCQNSYTMVAVSGFCTACAGSGACAGNYTATSAGQMTVYSCTWIGDNNNPLTPGSVITERVSGTTIKTETCNTNTSILSEQSCDYSGSPSQAVATIGTCTLGCNTTAGNQASCLKTRRVWVCDSPATPST